MSCHEKAHIHGDINSGFLLHSSGRPYAAHCDAFYGKSKTIMITGEMMEQYSLLAFPIKLFLGHTTLL